MYKEEWSGGESNPDPYRAKVVLSRRATAPSEGAHMRLRREKPHETRLSWTRWRCPEALPRGRTTPLHPRTRVTIVDCTRGTGGGVRTHLCDFKGRRPAD